MKPTEKPLIIITSILACAVGVLSLMGAGPLTPPGAPAPTMKSLDEIEPRINVQGAPASAVTTTDASYHYIITQPGSYYLSANLDVTKPNGIKINAEGVTLDLNGFQISRTSGSGGIGIELVPTAHRAGIRAGSIKGFDSGISCFVNMSSALSCEFRDLSVSGCTSTGINAGYSSVLVSCRAHGNSGAYAIYTVMGATLTNCVAYGNATEYGIYTFAGATLMNCTATNNTGSTGIYVGANSTATNCAAYDNTVDRGIYAASGATLSHCAAFINESASATSSGIATDDSVNLTNCNSTSNRSTAATLTSTTGMGFNLEPGCTIQNCTASDNAGDGIRIMNDTLVLANACDGNGALAGDGAGIHATVGDNRIEGNNVTDNDRGIDMDFSGSLIIKNSAAGNATNYVIAANNVFGAILDRTAPSSAAVSGNSAASSAGTTDPWANFAY